MSDDCWMKSRCYKYNHNEDAECRTDNIYCIKLFKLCNLYDEALITNTLRVRKTLVLDSDNSDLNAFNRLAEIESDIGNYVKEGNNLFIFSNNVGNGKTSWAVRLLQAYLEKIWISSDITCRGLFINVPKFFLSLKDNISNQNDYIAHIKEHVLSADIVVWDEVGTKSLTSFEFENLLSLIDSRINNGLTNIYTSNLCGAQLQQNIGDRLYSRIVNMSELIEFKGKDKRGIKV